MNKTKYLLAMLLIWALPFTVFGWSINKNSTIFDVMNLIKNAINFDNITIDSSVPYWTIQSVIEKYCPWTAIDEAKLSEQKIINTRSTISSSKKEKPLNDRFLLLKKTITKQDTKDINQYCKENYLLFSLLKTTQDLYHWDKNTIKSEYNVRDSVKNSSKNISWKNWWWNIDNQNHNSAWDWNLTKNIESDNNLKYNVAFTFNHNTSWLPEKEKKQFSKDTDKYLHEIIDDLVKRNIFNQTDISRLNNNINVTYQQSCKVTEWNFHVVRNKSTWNLKFKEINLIIAFCDTYNTPEKQKRHVKQILAHELWHYIYFFKDDNPSEFSEICRENWKMNCLPTDFVSSYSRKSPEEDYAESFAYWYLYSSDDDSNKWHGSAPDNPINRRERHFERLFESLEKDEEDDDDDKK